MRCPILTWSGSDLTWDARFSLGAAEISLGMPDSHLLDRTRRAWVAPARDGRYVLGQLRSRTAGVSFLSFWDGVCRHNWNGPKIEKSRLF